MIEHSLKAWLEWAIGPMSHFPGAVEHSSGAELAAEQEK